MSFNGTQSYAIADLKRTASHFKFAFAPSEEDGLELPRSIKLIDSDEDLAMVFGLYDDDPSEQTYRFCWIENANTIGRNGDSMTVEKVEDLVRTAQIDSHTYSDHTDHPAIVGMIEKGNEPADGYELIALVSHTSGNDIKKAIGQRSYLHLVNTINRLWGAEKSKLRQIQVILDRK